MGGRVGVRPTDYTSPLPMQPSGRPRASKRTPGRGVNKQHSIFYVWRGRCQCATSIYYYSYIYRGIKGNFRRRGDHYLAMYAFYARVIISGSCKPVCPAHTTSSPGPGHILMLDQGLIWRFIVKKKRAKKLDQKDGPVVSVHSVGGVTGDFVRDTALCQKTGTSNIEKKVIKKAVHTPFIEVYQKQNSGTPSTK